MSELDRAASRGVLDSPPRSVLVVGASGLIGSAVVARFAASGVRVRALARRPGHPAPHATWHPIDLAATTTPEAWLPHLAQIDAVVNCAGAMQGAAAALETVHVESTVALFSACERAGVRRFVHLSAIGADREPLSAFSASKQRAERALMATTLDWIILRPSVVVGRSAYGGSALLRALAALPFTPDIPDAGPLQIVQLDELVTTIVDLASPSAPARLALDVAGPERLTFTDAIRAYRMWLRLPSARVWRVPRALLALAHVGGDLAARLGWRPPLGTMARRELVRGAVGDPREWRQVSGIEPLPLSAALAREPASVQERWFANLYPLKPAVFGVLVVFWIATGVISLGPGWEEGTAYLREGGVPESLTTVGVVAGALADIAVGVGIAVRRTAKLALRAAVAVSLFYMITGTFVLPRLWADPVGPMLKIWPILVLIFVALAILDDR